MDITKLPLFDWDDKDKVIVTAAAIALASLFRLDPDVSAPVVNSVVSGLFGVAVGRKSG